MPDTPLNPDALHQLFAVAMMEVLDAEKLQPGNRLAHVNDIQEVLNRLEKNVLAVVQPVVNSVEELDALPAGSVVRDRHGRVWTAFEPRVSMPGVEYYRWMCPDGGFIRRKGWFSGFPATVLYRPEVDE